MPHPPGVPGTVPIRVPFVRPAMPPIGRLSGHYETIVASGRLTKGGYLEKLERELALHLGVRHAVAVSSCTVGLMLVYRSLALAAGRCASAAAGDCPVSRMRPLGDRFGDRPTPGSPAGEVVIPSFTFLAAPSAIIWNGLRPVFVDVDPTSTNVTAAIVAAAITPRTVAISACHNFGNPCDIDGLRSVADTHGLPLVIDAAHGFGASHRGRPVGAGATAQVFSLSPTKLLVAGEGGIVATDCDCLADFVRLGREYGNDGSYDALFPGVNGRMPELSAATALEGLRILDDVAGHRRSVAAAYRRRLEAMPGIGFVEIAAESISSHKDFSITVDPPAAGTDRDSIRGALAARGIETRCYYDPPCHRQRAFRDFHAAEAAPLPATDMLSARSVSLPIGPHIDEAVIDEVCEVIRGACRSG